MKQVQTLIISGASITASPWFTWADIVCEILKPKRVINLSARGTGNYYIALSCINSILNSDNETTLCIPMFTCIDKFDMYLDSNQTRQFADEKHKPLNINGQPASADSFSFWSTGSHWPLVKQDYQRNFFNVDIACVNNILLFHTLQTLCQDRGVGLLPLFDMQIWNYLEQQINDHVTTGNNLCQQDFTNKPLTTKIKSLLGSQWFEFESLIQYAMVNKLPIYNEINKLHPPSNVHLKWVNQWVKPKLQQQYHCSDISGSYLHKIDQFSQQW